MDAIDRRIIEELQRGIEVRERPFAGLAAALSLDEEELLARVSRLLDAGVLTRFGPMYDAEAMGGAFTLAAMCVPEEDFERTAMLVNAHPQVAHNYRREHTLNLWFVLACERGEDLERVIGAIERETGNVVIDLPKLDEYYLGLQLRPLGARYLHRSLPLRSTRSIERSCSRARPGCRSLPGPITLLLHSLDSLPGR
jgi:siroheme decarboxylase